MQNNTDQNIQDSSPNLARGEVAIELGGHAVKLLASMENVSKLMAALEVGDLTEIEKLYFPYREQYKEDYKAYNNENSGEEITLTGFDKASYFDLQNTLKCLKHLCTSHTQIELNKILHMSDLHICGMAVFETFHLAFRNDDEGKQEGPDNQVPARKAS